MKQHIILASSSPYRARLLQKLNIKFVSIAPNIDETPKINEKPAELAHRLAKEKAFAIQKTHPSQLIISSDQVASFDNQFLGKPGDFNKTIQQLSLQSGQSIVFYTSICVLDASSNKYLTDIDLTTVHFKSLSKKQIINYVEQEQAYDCAGGFKSEGLGICLFEKIDTEDPNALIGLPLIKLIRLLEKFDYHII